MVKLDNHWIETALVTWSRKDAASNVEFAAKTDEMTFGGGERDIDIKVLLNGGNMRMFKDMTIQEVSFKVYPADITSMHQEFFGNVTDVTQPLSVTNSLPRFETRVAIMWTDDTASTSAIQTTAASTAGIRFSGVGGLMTKCTPFWTNKELGFDVTFKIAPYTTAAVGTVKWESTDTTAVLPALGNYT